MTQIELLERKLETANVKNVYKVKNKLKTLKRKQIKEQTKSYSESFQQFLAR